MNIKEIYRRYNRLKDEHFIAVIEGADQEVIDDLEMELSYLEDQIDIYQYEKHGVNVWNMRAEMGV